MNRPILHILEQMIQGSRASDVGLAARRLSTGEEIMIHADQPFHPASTFKLCVMLEAFHQRHLGMISFEEALPVVNRFVSIADGSPYALDVNDDSDSEIYDCIGQSLPARELVERMITVSSNLATNILLERIRPAPVTAFMHALGADELIVRRGVEDTAAYRAGLNNSATARAFMQVLLKLARREVISTGDSDEMIEILARQQFNEMIPAQLPSGLRVAHKTGWTADYYHDVGIVYPPGSEPFVISILTKGYEETDGQNAQSFVASLAKAVYDYWNPRRP